MVGYELAKRELILELETIMHVTIRENWWEISSNIYPKSPKYPSIQLVSKIQKLYGYLLTPIFKKIENGHALIV